jgi:hypothetical protein
LGVSQFCQSTMSTGTWWEAKLFRCALYLFIPCLFHTVAGIHWRQINYFLGCFSYE